MTIQLCVRLAREIQEARDQLKSSQRMVRARAVKVLGMISPAWIAPDLKSLSDGADRRIAAIARQTLRQMHGADLPDRAPR